MDEYIEKHLYDVLLINLPTLKRYLIKKTELTIHK